MLKKKLGLLIYPGVQPMDAIGPWEVFSTWNNFLGDQIELYLVAETSQVVHAENKLIFTPHCSFENAPQFDYFLVPGGPGRREQVHNQTLLHFIQRQTESAEAILSVCTGIFLLQAAGLLDGNRATTYWRALAELKQFKEVQVVEQRYVHSGKIWSAAGISSGIDLALAFIAFIAGEESAGQVQLLFEYFPENKLYRSALNPSKLPPYSASNNCNEGLPAYLTNKL